jgi:hypothetical protein
MIWAALATCGLGRQCPTRSKQCFFEKKNQKLLPLWSPELRAPMAQRNQSFFASICSQKEVLSLTINLLRKR